MGCDGSNDAVAVSVRGLWVSYPDGPDVLRDTNLQVRVGERVGSIGPNGAGKTTLFLALCGVLRPQAGQILLFDRPVAAGRFRPEVGLVFQNPDDQLFSASVWDDVAFGPQNLGLSEAEVERRTRAALEVAGVADLAHCAPHHLSGGQKRMAAIASILSMQPKLVVYDEPTANLDLRSRRRLIEFLQSSHETLLVASHDLEFLLEACDRVILVDDGRIVADGDPAKIMGDAELMAAHGLEKPPSL